MSHRAVYKRAAPYADDALNLPVAHVATAIPYYERTFGFQVIERHDTPIARAVLARDHIQIGLAENGGDPENEGCFFEVDDVEAAFAEMRGRAPLPGDIKVQAVNGARYRAFFDVAPDGLCYQGVGSRTGGFVMTCSRFAAVALVPLSSALYAQARKPT